MQVDCVFESGQVVDPAIPRVERDEPLLEISTDKVDAEIPSPAAGVLAEIRNQEGETVPVNSIVAVLETDADADISTPAAASAPAEAQPAAPPAAAVAAAPSTPGPPAVAATPAVPGVFVSPVVRKIAAEHGIDPTVVPGTGSGGRVTKKDILAFVAQSFPQARLAPLDDAFAFARVQAFNSYLCATVHVAHAHRMRGTRWADDPDAIAELRRKVPEAVGECFGLIEREMFEGPWVMGENCTICDPYLFTLANWLEADGVDPDGLPKVKDHRQRMAERPAVARALAEERH